MPLFAANEVALPRELLWIIYFITFMMLVLALLLYRISGILRKYKSGEFATDDQKMWDNRNMWEKLFQLKPVGTDKDSMMDHNYDGIHELDNPPPPWFMGLFYATILFAIVYYIRFEITGAGPTQAEEYTAEIEAFENSTAVAGTENADMPMVDENTVELLTDAASLDAGKSIFIANCKVCHADGAKGSQSAPNLTDEYWLHGGGVKNIFKTIRYGVIEKGMLSWESTLKPHQIQQVASYIWSLQGSNPEGAFEAQGDLWVPEAEATEAPVEEAGAVAEEEAPQA